MFWKINLAIYLFLMLISQSVQAATNEVLLQSVKETFGDFKKYAVVRAFHDTEKEVLAKFSDSEIIQGLFLYLKDHDRPGSASAKKARAGMHGMTMLKFNHELISDTSSLREMLRNEDDPRDFFHLARIAWQFTKTRNEDFIPEHFQMLYKDGRVAREEGEYTLSSAHDVSVFAYAKIVLTLRKLNAEFIHPEGKGLTHEQEVDLLATWLIDNWPGCEDFKIPGAQKLGEVRKRAGLSGVERGSSVEAKSSDGMSPMTFKSAVIAAVLVLCAAFYWLKERRV